MHALDWQDFFRRRGASHVGFADLTELDDRLRLGHPRAIAFTVAVDPAVIAELRRDGPTRRYRDEYRRLNALVDEIAAAGVRHLAERGHPSLAAPSTRPVLDRTDLSTPLPHKTAALRAGLGWIGRSGLLVTADRGPAVRLGVILTHAPLPCARVVAVSHCGSCRACRNACPAGAITGTLWSWGMHRDELVDVEACYDECRRVAEAGLDELVCGRCMAACPLCPSEE